MYELHELQPGTSEGGRNIVPSKAWAVCMYEVAACNPDICTYEYMCTYLSVCPGMHMYIRESATGQTTKQNKTNDIIRPVRQPFTQHVRHKADWRCMYVDTYSAQVAHRGCESGQYDGGFRRRGRAAVPRYDACTYVCLCGCTTSYVHTRGHSSSTVSVCTCAQGFITSLFVPSTTLCFRAFEDPLSYSQPAKLQGSATPPLPLKVC